MNSYLKSCFKPFRTSLKHSMLFLRHNVYRFLGVEEIHQRLENLQRGMGEFSNWGRLLNEVASANQGVQHLLSHSYRASLHDRRVLPNLNEAEFRCFSQNGEDGILLYLFSVLGTTNKKVIEICAGNGIECNAANLIVNHGWFGLLVDGDERNMAMARQFYGSCRDTFSHPPALICSWATAENVNDLVSRHGFAGDVDLFSLDMDGMDYWVWKALTCINPRAVILEFNPLWGPDRAVTLPYKADFETDWSKQPWCQGASLGAFVHLGRERGYRLVGTNRQGFNAVFLRADTGADLFPEISVKEAFERNPILRTWTPGWLPSAAERPDVWNVVEV